jgi:O-6-methylguanine DNA methyltransferase
MTYYTFKETPAGALLLVGEGKVINGIYWKVFKRAPKVAADWIENKKMFTRPLKQIDEYFAGKRTVFDFDFVADGTNFQKKVWKELSRIPFGASVSYKTIAKKIGKPKAVRAVGTAIGSNPMSIVVPCHRVLTSAGKLGGFAGGLKSKEVLLKKEKIKYA